MRSQDSLRFQDHWESFRAEEELVPQRSSVRPEVLRDLLKTTIIAQVDEEGARLDVRLAGTTIRDYIGFELTGRNFLDFDESSDDANGQEIRKNYHDWPCGRFERLNVVFSNERTFTSDVTVLPLWGNAQERLLLVLVEPPLMTKLGKLQSSTLVATQNSIFATSIDIGNGVPKYDQDACSNNSYQVEAGSRSV